MGHTKTLRTELVELRFLVRRDKVAAAQRAMAPYAAMQEDEERIPWKEVFPEFGPGDVLAGLRSREGITQQELAERIGISRSNLSAMEHGKRTIGKEMAKRLAAALGTDYRVFL